MHAKNMERSTKRPSAHGGDGGSAMPAAVPAAVDGEEGGGGRRSEVTLARALDETIR